MTVRESRTERDAGARESAGLRRRLRRHLRQRPELIPPGSRAVVAVSGGPDSMVLLDLMTSMARAGDRGADEPGPAGPGSVVAAHFDHGLRPESGREARRVVQWCRSRGVPWAVGGPRTPLTRDPAACRRARYAFLAALAEQVGAERVLTAHHADDQAETVLFRLLRGTELAGLRGVRPRDGRVARPLLPFRKRELVDHARRRGLPCHRDPSNRDRGFSRSQLRHRLLPALLSRDPSIGAKLCRIARLAQEAEGALADLDRAAVDACRMPVDGARTADGTDGGGAIRLSRSRLRRLPPELQGRAVRRIARARGIRLTRGGTRSAVEFIRDGRSGGRVDLGGGLRLGRDFDFFWLGRETSAGDGEGGDRVDRPVTFRLPGSGTARARIGGVDYGVAWGTGAAEDPGSGGLILRLAAIPASRQLELHVRGREAGDRVRLPGGTRKLQDVFVDRRLPRSLRRRVPVLAEGESPRAGGEGGSGGGRRVLWVPGICRASDLEGAGSRAAPASDACWVIITGTGQLAPGAT